MTSPVEYERYLAEVKAVAEGLLTANGMRGSDWFLRGADGKPLQLGGASTNAAAHALGSAYLAYDHSPMLSSALGWGREIHSYFDPAKPVAWDTFKDLYNNQAGRNIAAYVRQNNLSREQIQDLVLDALTSGKLIVTHDDKRIDPSFNGNPLNFRMPEANGSLWTVPSAGFSDYAKTITRVAPDGSPDSPSLQQPSLQQKSGLDPDSARPGADSSPAKEAVNDNPGTTELNRSGNRVFVMGTAPMRFTPPVPNGAPGGLPGLMAASGLLDPVRPDQPPAGGLLALIQDYMRDNPDIATNR
jgi:hypothetical protein